jgi:phage terminase large subunit
LNAISSILRIQTARVFSPLLKSARYKGAHGGRGSGKSHFFAEALVEQSLMRPLRAVCVREVQKSLEQSSKRLLEDKIATLGVGTYFDVKKAEIELPHGGLCIFQGMQNHTADSIKSLEGYDVAWVDEAQNLSERSLTLLRPTIRKPGSELWFSWNPEKPEAPIEKLLRGNDRPPDSVVVEANYSDNPWFTDVLRSEMEYDRRRDPEKYQHVWCGKYLRKSEARVFKNWRVDHFETPDNARFYFGADWGFSVDPSVLIRCFIVDRTLYVDREAYQVGCPIDHTPALFQTIPGSDKWPIRADSARPDTINYMRRHGFPKMESAVKGKNSIEDGIEFLKSHDIVVHPSCRHTIDELTMYSWETDPKTEEILPVLEDKNNHVIDALRYAVEGARRQAPKASSGSFARN